MILISSRETFPVFLLAKFAKHRISCYGVQPSRERSIYLAKRVETAIRFIKRFRAHILCEQLKLRALQHVIDKGKDLTLVAPHQFREKLYITVLDFAY